MSVAPIPSSPVDLELIEKLRCQLQYAQLKIQLLEERLRLMRLEKYGASGEKLSDAQLELFKLDLSGHETAPADGVPQATMRHKNASRKHPGRQELPEYLPRVEQVLACPPDQRVCKKCGKEMMVIGYEQSCQLDVFPAKYFVLVTKREKRACKACEEQGVVEAPLPSRIIEKSLAADSVVIDTIIRKYCDHIPLHRQSTILEREAGLRISRATLDGWTLKVGELLIPLVAAMRRELLAGDYIQADETPVDVQLHEGRGKNHQSYLWSYGRPEGSVVFDFRMSRGREGPKQFLGPFEGILQTDGCAGYEKVGGPKLVHAGCWAHARRLFFEAVQLYPKDPMATAIVAHMDDLFAIDAEVRREGLSIESRDQLRQQRAVPLLQAIREKSKRHSVPPCPPVRSAKPAAMRLACGRN